MVYRNHYNLHRCSSKPKASLTPEATSSFLLVAPRLPLRLPPSNWRLRWQSTLPDFGAFIIFPITSGLADLSLKLEKRRSFFAVLLTTQPLSRR